jgi:hypothetical protein
MTHPILLSILFASTPSRVIARPQDGPIPRIHPDVAPALEAWRSAHGPGWRLKTDVETGWLEMLSGGWATAPFRPRSQEDFVEIARITLARTEALHGIDADTRVFDRALFLPLGQIGSGDKETVRFREIVHGVPVVGGYLNVLLAADGSLLSIQSTGLPHLSALPTSPSLTGLRAAQRAAELFVRQFGLEPTRITEPELVVDQVRTDDGARLPRLAWQVDAQWIQEGSDPEGLTFWIDARDGSLVRSERNIHFFDVGGTVGSMATPGTNPDTAANPETAQIMKYMRVDSSAGTVFTDANGYFVFPGVAAPLSCTFTYRGSFNDVVNVAGANYSLTQTLLPGQSNSVSMNPASIATVTSQANVFNVVDKQRDFVRSINPADGTMDFPHSSVVNLGQTCNAFFDGGGINFFAAGGGCVNTAYSTVISHEDGHWGNQVYLTGNGADGMGEGNADVWAMYIWDTPVVGAGFFGTGSQIRNGNNTQAFCGDCCGGCYGEVHADGEPWMGAAWKVRNRLNNTHGDAMGDLIANTIFVTWMEAYNQSQIKSVIETQWLTLDDSDGNINNGTPHFNDIDMGFRDQSFPGVVLLPVSYGPVTEIADTEIQDAPQTVAATVYANAAPPFTAALLRYRVNVGAFQDVPLVSLGGDQYSATIPGQLAPALVEYYLTATDSASHTATYPRNAPAGLLDYDVGEVHVVRLDGFEGQSGQGWTHGTFGDTSNVEDDWQRTGPAGESGTSGGIAWSDPPAAFRGHLCWGNDLGVGSLNTGAYSANVHNWLRSPSIDCTGAVGTKLRFKRWLTVQGSASDQARVKVNGNVMFSNPTADLVDTGWTNQQIDISALADNNPSVQLEFELESNATTQLGGWQIDDVELLWVGVPQCPTPLNYCFLSPNSVDPLGALMGWSGTSIVPNNDFVLRTSGCPPHRTGLYFYGRDQTIVPFGNGYRCVASPFKRLPATATDSSGNAAFNLDLNNLPAGGQIAAGENWNFQFWFRDPAAGGAGYNVSDGLTVTFCP